MLIPFLIIIGSLVGVFVIVYRKAPALKALELQPLTEKEKNLFVAILEEITMLLKRRYTEKSRETGGKSKKIAILKLTAFMYGLFLIAKITKNILREGAKKFARKPRSKNPNFEAKQKEIREKIALPLISAATGQEDLRKKEETLIHAITRNPQKSGLYYKLGLLYVRTKEYQDAREAFTMVLRLEPGNLKAQEELDKIISLV